MYKPWERFDIGTGYGRCTPRFMGIAEIAIGALAVGATAYSAYSASQSADNQVKAQQDATKSSLDMQLYQFNQQQANTQPWRDAGTGAVNQLAAGIQPGGRFANTPTYNHAAFDPASANLLQDPGYQFRVKQGTDARVAAGAAAGNLGSGRLGTALTQFGQDMGSQEYQNMFNRGLTTYNTNQQNDLNIYNSLVNAQSMDFNRLSGIAGTGQTAVGQVGAAGMNMANNSQNALMSGAANNQQAQQWGQQQTTNGLQGVSNQLMGGLQAYNYYNGLGGDTTGIPQYTGSNWLSASDASAVNGAMAYP